MRADDGAFDRADRNSYSAFGSPYNEMTQTSSAIIVTVKYSMEYAELCMSMRLDNACYFGNSGRVLAAAGYRPMPFSLS